MMEYGYYWVKRKHKSDAEVAKLTKNGGWQYFDGSHHKMIPNKPLEILEKIEYILNTKTCPRCHKKHKPRENVACKYVDCGLLYNETGKSS